MGTPRDNNGGDRLKSKKKKINHSQLGADFVAPEFESSWSWFIIVAAGCSNVRKNDENLIILTIFHQNLMFFDQKLMEIDQN